MNTFSDNLKRLRKSRNLKQEDLAEKLNVTRQTVSGWETGRRQPDLDMLKNLADVLEADIQELIYGTKPGAYPRFQRRYVLQTCISGTAAAAYLIFRIFLQRWVVAMCNSYYWDYPRMLIFFVVPIVGLFSAGHLVPSAFALNAPVRFRALGRSRCLVIGALLAVIPVWIVICNVFGYYVPLTKWISWFVLYDEGRSTALYILPFLSGLFVGLWHSVEHEE